MHLQEATPIVSGGATYVTGPWRKLFAHDALSGEMLWATQTIDNSKPYTIASVQRVMQVRVLIGNRGVAFGGRD